MYDNIIEKADQTPDKISFTVRKHISSHCPHPQATENVDSDSETVLCLFWK